MARENILGRGNSADSGGIQHRAVQWLKLSDHVGIWILFQCRGKAMEHFKCESLLSLIRIFTKNHSACHAENGFLGVQGWRKGDQSEKGRVRGRGKRHKSKTVGVETECGSTLCHTWFLSFLFCYCAFIFHFTDILVIYVQIPQFFYWILQSRERIDFYYTGMFHELFPNISPWI